MRRKCQKKISVRGYAGPIAGITLDAQYIPHGVMIGAGLVAVTQIAVALTRGDRQSNGSPTDRRESTSTIESWFDLRTRLAAGFAQYLVAAAGMSPIAGLAARMDVGRLALFIVFAAVAALVHDLIVGISAMHAGWFPAFATALIFLILGLLIGFPPVPLALLVGFTASTGPAFADLGYDFKTGWLIRGQGIDPLAERAGRRQQFVAAMLGFVVAAMFVWAVHERYFEADRLPPADRVYAATIQAGANRDLLGRLLVWAIPGALVQAAGGASRQLGVLFATGLLIQNPGAGWAALAALAVRRAIERRYGVASQSPMYVVGGGFLAGSALTSFASATVRWR